MRPPVIMVALILAAMMIFSRPTNAEDTTKPVFVLGYIEIIPSMETQGRRLIAGYTAEARKAAGALHIEALTRNGYANQFALLEEWKSEEARTAFRSSDAAQHFHDSLERLQSAGYDERILEPLFAGPENFAPMAPITVLTHIDVITDGLDQAKAEIARFINLARHKNSNIRLDILVQTDRSNHMTLVEGWPSKAAKDAEMAQPDTIALRQDLLKFSGSPYDERLYRPLSGE